MCKYEISVLTLLKVLNGSGNGADKEVMRHSMAQSSKWI